jgi:membrane protein YdbS with pleckstrin-like domain
MRLQERVSGPAAVDRYLLPREQQHITVRKHPAVLIAPCAEAVIGLLVAVVLTATVLRSNNALSLVVWLAWIVLFLRMIWKAVNWTVDFFVVTSKRMLLTSGLLNRKVAMMPLTRVTDMSFRRNFAGRILGYGEFIVESAGQDQAFRIVDHIPYPEQLYLAVCDLLFPPDPCTRCKGKGKIMVPDRALAAEYRIAREYGQLREFLQAKGDMLVRGYRVAEDGPEREELLAQGYEEIVCPRCEGTGAEPAESEQAVGSSGDGT